MHFYIYDERLDDQRYARTIAGVEAKLTDLDLQGRFARLTPLRGVNEAVRTALKAGATTIVAVGNDRTVAETVNAIATAGANVTLGVIPVGWPATIATLLGLPAGEAAVPILAARKIEVVDLGKVSGYYFLTAARVEAAAPVTLECEDGYTVQAAEGPSDVSIVNLRAGSRCQDGYLEATISSKTWSWWRPARRPQSLVPLRRGRITGAGAIVAENCYTVNLPATVEVAPRRLKVIVGRDRVF